MRPLTVSIDSDMGFPAKMPSVAFLSRTYLGIVLLGLALLWLRRHEF